MTTNAGRLSEPTRTTLEALGASVDAMPFDMDTLLEVVANAGLRLPVALPYPQPLIQLYAVT